MATVIFDEELKSFSVVDETLLYSDEDEFESKKKKWKRAAKIGAGIAAGAALGYGAYRLSQGTGKAPSGTHGQPLQMSDRAKAINRAVAAHKRANKEGLNKAEKALRVKLAKSGMSKKEIEKEIIKRREEVNKSLKSAYKKEMVQKRSERVARGSGDVMAQRLKNEQLRPSFRKELSAYLTKLKKQGKDGQPMIYKDPNNPNDKGVKVKPSQWFTLEYNRKHNTSFSDTYDFD